MVIWIAKLSEASYCFLSLIYTPTSFLVFLFFFLPTVEHFRLLLPKGRSHHAGAREGGGSAAETGPGERRDPQQAVPPRPSL